MRSRRKAMNEFAAMPFEERMDYELWEARQRLDNWHPFNMEFDDEPLP